MQNERRLKPIDLDLLRELSFRPKVETEYCDLKVKKVVRVIETRWADGAT